MVKTENKKKKILTLRDKKEIQKIIDLFADKTGCDIQTMGCPCNSDFNSIDADFQHICWLIIPGLRGDYDSKEILWGIKNELYR